MANIKSAKKQAKKNVAQRKKNLARKTSLKTASKKVLSAIERGDKIEKIQELFKDAEAKLARAKGKHVLHAKTASRKISRLAKRVQAQKKASEQ